MLVGLYEANYKYSYCDFLFCSICFFPKRGIILAKNQGNYVVKWAGRQLLSLQRHLKVVCRNLLNEEEMQKYRIAGHIFNDIGTNF